MSSNKENGFTLMEVIVGINLGFLVISVIISFFLFSTKFVRVTTTNLDERQTVNEFILRLNKTFRSASNFNFIQTDSNYIFTINEKDTVLISNNSFSLKSIYDLDNIQKYNLMISSYSNENIIIQNGELLKAFYNDNWQLQINSGEIKNIDLAFRKDGKSYQFYYVSPDISINKFRNIKS